MIKHGEGLVSVTASEGNNMDRYTPEGLPILTESTVDMHFVEEARLDTQSENNLLSVMETRAEETFRANPVIEKALDRFCQLYGFEGMDELTIKVAGLYIYQLLKKQAEVNRLNDLTERLK